jgi:SAM-dependent methyltransferase
VAVFNVLEHTYDPIQVMQNVRRITSPGGAILVSTPVVWPVHNFPGDFVRLLPDWYIQFADQNHLVINPDTFCWLSYFGITPINQTLNHSQSQIPNFLNSGLAKSPTRYWISRIIHRLFNTFGRTHVYGNVAISAAFQVPG